VTRRRALTLARTVDQFCASLELAGRRPRGVETYRAILDTMLEVLGADTDPRSLEHPDFLEVVASWRGTSTTTVAQRVSVLRAFGSWLQEEHDVPDPTVRLKRPKKRRPVRRRPDADVVGELYRVARGRDRLVVAVLAMTGMRVDELRGLRWRDVNEQRCLVHIEDGKGGKGRTVPIPAALGFLLRDERAARQPEPEHYVACQWAEWETPTGGKHLRTDPARPCGAATAYKILERLSAAAGVPRVSPHQLRRAYADAYLRAHPGDLVGLQFLLGHESITTTRDYLEGVRVEEAAERVASVDFVTPAAADNVTPVRIPPQPGETPWYSAEMEAAGIEPAFAEDPSSARVEPESTSGLATPGSDKNVAPDGGGS
jgi:integrase